MRGHFWSLSLFVLLVLSASTGATEPPPDEEPIYQGKTLTEWLDDLKDPKEETHRQAAVGLVVFGPRKEIVASLAAALKRNNQDELFVLRAAQTLGKFGSKARESLPALRAALKEFEKPRGGEIKAIIREEVRQALTEALVRIDDHPGSELAPFLINALQTKDLDKRRDIVILLGKLGPDAAKLTVPALVAILAETDKYVRKSFGGYSNLSDTEDPREKSIQLRLQVVKSLSQLGPAAKPALHALTLAMKTAAPEKSPAVMTTQVSDKPAGSADGTIRTISFTLVTGDEVMLRACAEALGRIHPDARGTVAALRLALRDLDEGVRWAALCALLHSGQDRKDLVPILRNILRDKDASLRRAAVQVLGKSHAEAREVLPSLMAALKDGDAAVREAAAEALGEMGRPAKRAAPALVVALKDSQANVRRAAAAAVGNIGDVDEEAIAALIALLQDKDDTVVGAAGWTLSKFGDRAKAAIPVLLPRLEDSNPEKRGGWCLILGAFGSTARGIVPVLERISREDSNECVRLVAHTALARIVSSRLKDTVRLLTTSLESKKDEVREVTIECLLFLGPDAREALPALRRLRDSGVNSERRFDFNNVIETIENAGKDKINVR